MTFRPQAPAGPGGDGGRAVMLVTGAAGGIGAALTTVLSARGDLVVATDLRLDGLEERAKAEGWARERVRLLRLDVADPDGWERVLRDAEAAFGPVDVLFNVAGYLKPGRVRETAVEDVLRHLDANAKGAILGTRAAARSMAARGAGHIVNVASMAALAPVPGLALYSASKHAVRAFSLAAAEELRPAGVAVTVVCPDAVATPMLDAQLDDPSAALTFSGGRVLTAREVAELLAGPVLESRRLEVAFPPSRAWLARIANLFPALAARLRPGLERKGLARQAKLRDQASRGRHSDSPCGPPPAQGGAMKVRDWKALSSDYAAYHTTRGNQVCHAIGIPLIVFAVVAWTIWPGSRLPVAGLVLPVYFVWDPRLGLAMALLVGAFAGLAPLVPPAGVWAAFVVGWIFQLVGHQVYEKRSPAFTRNLMHLLVGPAWILQKGLR